MRIKWDNGVLIEHEETRILLDPRSKRLSCKVALVTHAHIDHSQAFKANYILKFSSEETMNLVTLNGVKVSKWQPLALRERRRMDDFEVISHPSGHVLGSYGFEIITPEGTILYTGDLNTRDARTVKPAEPVQCDTLIIESTFGSPDFIFPPDDLVIKDMIDWANNILRDGKIPVFHADSLGNAQEIIRIFNENTVLPVITHKAVSRINRVYEYYGYKMEYTSMETEDAHSLISNRNAVIVAPKWLDLSRRSEYVSALVSGWALKLRRKSFPLSDHADFPNLIKFVSDCNPKLVLTCHGGKFNNVLARYIEKKLRIRAYPIDLIPTSFTKKTESSDKENKM